MENKDREMRVMTPEDVELRIEGGETPKLVGYAAKFDRWSENLGFFREKIQKGAFDDVIDDDVRALKNHSADHILGRSPKTLRLSINSVGLRFEIDMPDTTIGRDTLEEVRRGDISGCSFAFVTGEDDWVYKEDGSVDRTVIKLSSLLDIGPVVYPAYPDTTVAARSLDKIRAENEKRAELEAKAGTEPELDTNEEVIEGDSEAKVTEEGTEEEKSTISAERQREIEKGYRKCGRIIGRCRPKAD